MEDDLNFSENGRRPQFFRKMEDNQNFIKMEDDPIFIKMEDDLNFIKMEDDLNFIKMEDSLNFQQNRIQPQNNDKMENGLI